MLRRLHGNLTEWCLDWAAEGGDEGQDPVGAQIDPKGRRCKPSGAWSQEAYVCASRCVFCTPATMSFGDSGFRLFMTPGGYLKESNFEDQQSHLKAMDEKEQLFRSLFFGREVVFDIKLRKEYHGY